MTSSSTRRRLDHSDWSGTEELYVEYQFTDISRYPPPFFRFVNGLDVEVELSIGLTDAYDESVSREERPPFYLGSKTVGWPPMGGFPGSQTTENTLTISSGAVESYSVPTSWDVIRCHFTPTTNPSSGEITVIDMK